MAIDFTGVETTEWIGQVVGQPTTLCGKEGRYVLININWNLYELSDGDSVGLKIDMDGIAPANQLDLIRSVYIDNIASPTAMYVYFPDTGFTAVAAPYSSVWAPVITKDKTAIIYGIGFTSSSIPLTNVFFTNIFVPYSVQTLGPETNIDPASATYLGTDSTQLAADTTQAQFTFNAFPIGTAFAARRVAIAVHGGRIDNGATDSIISSATIGGVAATQINSVAATGIWFTGGGGGVTRQFAHRLSLLIAAVPTGVTATVVINWANARNFTRICGWSIEGIITDAQLDEITNGTGSYNTGLSQGPAPGVRSVSGQLATASRGCVISCFAAATVSQGVGIPGYPSEPTISGVSKDETPGLQNQISGGTGASDSGASLLTNPAALNNIVTAVPAYNVGGNWSSANTGLMCAASFQPS